MVDLVFGREYACGYIYGKGTYGGERKIVYIYICISCISCIICIRCIMYAYYMYDVVSSKVVMIMANYYYNNEIHTTDSAI